MINKVEQTAHPHLWDACVTMGGPVSPPRDACFEKKKYHVCSANFQAIQNGIRRTNKPSVCVMLMCRLSESRKAVDCREAWPSSPGHVIFSRQSIDLH